jgi:hypothetical protein
VLRYQAINKNETFLPDTLRYKSKNGEERTLVYDDENEVVSYSSDDAELNDYRKRNTAPRIKKDKRKKPLTDNDEELYPHVKTLIEEGYFKKEHVSGWKKKSSLSNYIDIDKLDVDYEKVIPEDGEHLEKKLTEDDYVYLDRKDTDFVNYYLHNQKTYGGLVWKNQIKRRRRYCMN